MLDRGAVVAFGEDACTLGIVGAPAVPADKPFVHQAFENVAHAGGAVEVVLAVMEEVDIDVIGLQPAQAAFARLADRVVGHRQVAVVVVDSLVFVEHRGEFRRNHDAVAATRECAPQDPFAVPGAVVVCRVEEVDAAVERAVDRADRFVVVDLAPAHRRVLTV